MVARTSKKVAKFTYAERVLSALSQVQKEHRKHAVHMATVRAQVRKAAEVKKDKLGPQWSRWVGKAVHKLEDDGVLELTDPIGCVAFTPVGKKAIAAARRNVNGGSPHASPAQEGLIWRNLSHELSVGGLKRKQPSSRMPSVVEFGHEDEDEEDEQPTPSKKHIQSRKTTVSARKSAGKNPVSKMTKAELIAELQSIREAHTNATLHSSQVTDSDNAEADQLREELRSRQDEIEAIRKELSELKQTTAADNTETIDNEGPYSRPVTPLGLDGSSPTGPNSTNILDHLRPSFAVRTQSGSFISAISKRPTPAPSSPGMDQDHVYFLENNDDIFGSDNGGIIGLYDNVSEPGRDLLATPDMTPANLEGTKTVELAKEVARLKALNEEVRKEASDIQKVLQDKTLVLETLQSAHASVVSDSRHETTFLRTEIQSLRHAMSERNDALTSKDAQISQLRSAIATLEATKADQRTNLEDLQGNLASSHGKIEEQNLMISHLERTAEEVISQRASVTAEMSDILTSNESLKEKLQEAEATNDALWEQLAAEVEKTLQADRALTEARTARVAVKAKARIMDDAMVQAKSNELMLHNSLSDEEAKSHALGCKVDTLESVIKTLNGSLETTRIAAGELKEQLSASVERGHKLSQVLAERDEMIIQLSNLKEEALEQMSALSREASNHKEDLSRLHSALETIGLQLGTSKEEAARLALELGVKERERDECAAEVSQINAVRLRLSAQIEDDQKTIGELRVETHAAQGTINVLHETIEEYRSKQAAVALAREMDVSSLKSSLASMEIEVATARSQLASLQTSRAEIVQRLQSTTVELNDARAALEAEINHASVLGSDVQSALRRAREAEEKVVYLKQSGDANEVTIEALKAGYAAFRKAQMDALMELDGKVESAHSYPSSARN